MLHLTLSIRIIRHELINMCQTLPAMYATPMPLFFRCDVNSLVDVSFELVIDCW